MRSLIITEKINKILGIIYVFLLLFLYLANVENINKSVFEALNFCYKSLIPSLFPTLILSSIILCIIRACGIFEGRKNVKKLILDNCKIYTAQIITGMLCGFVVGPRSICELQKENDINERHFSMAVALSSNAGVGFVIGYVGMKIWNDIILGIVLYSAQILSAVILYFLFNSKDMSASLLKPSMLSKNKQNVFSVISDSVTGALSSMLLICSFNIFSSIVIGLISANVPMNNIGEVLSLTLIDFSSAISKTSLLPNKHLSLFFTGFSIGFAGFSVHLQTFSVCEMQKLNKKLYLSFKLLQGLFCGALTMLFAMVYFLKF